MYRRTLPLWIKFSTSALLVILMTFLTGVQTVFAQGWIYYAKLNADGSDLVSTGIRYQGGLQTQAEFLAAQGVKKHLKISHVGIARKVQAARQALRANPAVSAGTPMSASLL